MDDLAALGIERACHKLVIAYTHLIDFGEAGKVADLFTDDGVWESAQARMEGRSEIADGFGRREANEGRRSRHVLTNIAVEVGSDHEATGLSYFTLYRVDGVTGTVAPLDGPEMVGHYRDRFALTGAGWRIAHRTAEAAFVRRPTP